MPQVTALPLTVAHDELVGSPVETDAMMDFQATRTVRCPWPSRLVLADEFLTGYLVNLGEDCDGNAVISRMGQQYPYRAGVYADSCQIKPWSTAGTGAVNGFTNLMGYEWAQIEVHYRPFPFDPTFGTLLAEESTRMTTQVVSVPGTLFWGDNTALAAGEQPVKVINILEWSVTFRQLLNVPSCWFNAVSCVNDDDVTSPLLNRTFAAESLKVQAPECTRVVGENTVTYWNVTLRFSHLLDATGATSGMSWNYVFRGANPGQAYTNPVAQPVYTASGFTMSGTPAAPVPGTLSEFKQYAPISFENTFFL